MSSTEPKRRLTADARREQLLETARIVFMRSGLGGTTVRDISEAAGVNIALLYRHFESKEDLFDAAVARPLEEALDGIVAQASSTSSYANRPDVQRQNVMQLIVRLLDAMAEITPLLGVVLFSDRGAEFHRRHLQPAITTLAEAAEVSKLGFDGREYDSDPLAMTLIGACFMYGLRETFGGPETDRLAVAGELTDLIFDGVVRRT